MSYDNPSAWPRRLLVCILAGIAIVISVYLALYEWGLTDTVWDPIFGNGTMNVLRSNVSKDITNIVRVPDAILGSIAYVGDLVFALAGSTTRWYDRPWLIFFFAFYVMVLGAVGITLVALQGLIVGSFCFLCLCSAAISLTLVFLAFDEVRTCFSFLFRVWKKKRSWIALWAIFWGQGSPLGFEAAKETALMRRK
jgi:uncharacterized membrane protein